MEYSIKDIIRDRRSVRTYSGEPLRSEDRSKLEEFINSLESPFGVPVEFRFLEGKKYGLTSPVLVGADLYLGAKVPRAEKSEIAFGYDFEKVVLYAQSLGIGTVWIAGTMNRPAFEKAMEVKENEVMHAITPIGYTADKMSVRESVMRRGVKADERLPFETLFFRESFSSPLTQDDAGKLLDALMMVRLAPSAVNKQPWRVVVCGDTVHFYKKGSRGMAEIQKVDIGIAIAHLVLTLSESGVSGEFVDCDPKLEHGDDTEYIISYVIG